MSGSSFSHSSRHGGTSDASGRFHPYPSQQSQRVDGSTAFHGAQGQMLHRDPMLQSSSHGYLSQPGLQRPSLPPPSSFGRPPPSSDLYNDHGSYSDGRRTPVDADTRMPSRSTTPGDSVPAGEVERLAGRHGVDIARLNEFNEMSLSRKLLEIFALQLQQATAGKETDKLIKAVDTRVTAIDVRTGENFKPSALIKKSLTSMTRHFLYQPVISYQTVQNSTINYYKTLPKENHPLTSCGYTKDKVVKDAIHKLLKDFGGSERSHLRPMVWKMVQKRTALSKWVKHMDEHYDRSGPNRAAYLVKQQTARLALMREVAEPLVPLPAVRGQDTGFWHKMEERLTALYAQLGPDIANNNWDRWATEIIGRDKYLYRDESEGQFELPELDAQDVTQPEPGSP